MKIKTLKTLVLIFALCSANSLLFAQQKTDNSIDGRYIIINDLSSFFETSDNQTTCYLTIYNIQESESSKPLHIEVNNLHNVVKFSIKSTSEEYENQRNSKLIMNSLDYQNTFRNSLLKMNIKYIILDGEMLLVNDFYSRIK